MTPRALSAGLGALLAGLGLAGSLAAGAAEPRLAPNPTPPTATSAAAPRPGPAAPAPAMHAVPVAGGQMLILDEPAGAKRAGSARNAAPDDKGTPVASGTGAMPTGAASPAPAPQRAGAAQPAFDSAVVNGRTVRVLRDPAAPERKARSAAAPTVAPAPTGLREETGPNGARMLVVAPTTANTPEPAADPPRPTYDVLSIDALAPGTEPRPMTLYRGH